MQTFRVHSRKERKTRKHFASPLSQTLGFFFPVPSVLLHHASLCLQEQYRNANLCNNLPLSLLHVLSDCFWKNGNYPTASLIEMKLSKVTEAHRVHLQLLQEIAPSSLNRICSTLGHAFWFESFAGGAISLGMWINFCFTPREGVHTWTQSNSRKKGQREKRRENNPDVKSVDARSASHVFVPSGLFDILSGKCRFFLPHCAESNIRNNQWPVKKKRPRRGWRPCFFSGYKHASVQQQLPQSVSFVESVLTQFNVIYFWEGVVRISGICELLKMLVLTY